MNRIDKCLTSNLQDLLKVFMHLVFYSSLASNEEVLFEDIRFFFLLNGLRSLSFIYVKIPDPKPLSSGERSLGCSILLL